MDDEDKIRKALLKKALGYNADEVIEEYALNEGEEVLVKKKVTKKHYGPDVSAVKILLERYYQTYQELVKNIYKLDNNQIDKLKSNLKKAFPDWMDQYAYKSVSSDAVEVVLSGVREMELSVSDVTLGSLIFSKVFVTSLVEKPTSTFSPGSPSPVEEPRLKATST